MKVQRDCIIRMISKGKRLDGRKLDETRKIVIENGYIEQAEGSSLVKLGNTEVAAGVKMDVGEPFPDTPDKGVLIVNAEFSPLASPEFELGPPRENAIELARIVDRGIRESGCIDTENLCIKEGERVWMVFVDIQPLSHDGNLIDASGIGAISALMNVTLPKYEDDKVIYGEKTKKALPVKEIPVPITLAQINNMLVVDPSLEEEKVMVSRLTATTKGNGNICALQKGGNGGFSMDKIEEAIDISLKKGKEIRKLLGK